MDFVAKGGLYARVGVRELPRTVERLALSAARKTDGLLS
jgi:hypothetical protein